MALKVTPKGLQSDPCLCSAWGWPAAKRRLQQHSTHDSQHPAPHRLYTGRDQARIFVFCLGAVSTQKQQPAICPHLTSSSIDGSGRPCCCCCCCTCCCPAAARPPAAPLPPRPPLPPLWLLCPLLLLLLASGSGGGGTGPVAISNCFRFLPRSACKQ
jgi:hypothetical protein